MKHNVALGLIVFASALPAEKPVVQMEKLREWVGRSHLVTGPAAGEKGRALEQLRRSLEHTAAILAKVDRKVRAGGDPAQEMELLTLEARALERAKGEVGDLSLGDVLSGLEGLGRGGRVTLDDVRSLRSALAKTVGTDRSTELVSVISTRDEPGSTVPASLFDAGPPIAQTATDPPTAADRAASAIVQLTPEIRARAEALGGDPCRSRNGSTTTSSWNFTWEPCRTPSRF